MKLSDAELWEYIREDVPYLDLTTYLLDGPECSATLTIRPRERVVAACTEEAARIAELLGCEVESCANSGTWIENKDLLVIRGSGESLHQAWRTCQILLEYACGMATYAREMLDAAHAVNPGCEIFVTRKSFPFAKRFCVRALLCGGVLPHRLGLSETVLVFDQHRALYEDAAAFESALAQLKSRCAEKKLVVESESLEDAKKMLELGADVIQMDKAAPELLEQIVAYKREHHPHTSILAAGGIHKDNVALFASSGVEGIVTSRPYQAGMADLKALWS